MIAIVPAHASHIDTMIGHLRPEHVAELAAKGLTDRTALELGLRHSVQAWTALDADAAVAMFGFTAPAIVGDFAHPWGITTIGTERHKLRFWRETRAFIAALRQRYGVLANEFDTADGEACRILRHLGFVGTGGTTFELRT
jgi:hypothetical protein